MSHRGQSSGVIRSDYEVSHEDVTHARIRECYSSPLRNVRQVWFLDIFTLKNLIGRYLVGGNASITLFPKM